MGLTNLESRRPAETIPKLAVDRMKRHRNSAGSPWTYNESQHTLLWLWRAWAQPALPFYNAAPFPPSSLSIIARKDFDTDSSFNCSLMRSVGSPSCLPIDTFRLIILPDQSE